MEDLLAYLARTLVDRPDEVSVETFEEEDGTIVLELHVGEDDTGKVIGRGGRTVAARLPATVLLPTPRQGQRRLDRAWGTRHTTVRRPPRSHIRRLALLIADFGVPRTSVNHASFSPVRTIGHIRITLEVG